MCSLTRRYGGSKVLSLDCSRKSVMPVDVERQSNVLSLLLRRENKGLKRPERNVGAFLGVGMSIVVEILSPLRSLLA